MKQPELGKKIAELRKNKGLTQEELVDVCNLNVRTLQRIESGEVTPRSYTLKIITEALDYNIQELITDNEGSDHKQNLRYRFMQIRFYTFDLFNFKTDTMRKIMTFTTIALATALFFMAFTKDNENTQSTKEVKETISKLAEKYKFWYNHGVVDSCMSILSDDVCMVNNWLILKGKKSIREQLLKIQPHHYKFIEKNVETFNHSGSIVVVRGSATVQSESGETFHTKTLTEWHFIKGEWKIVNSFECVH